MAIRGNEREHAFRVFGTEARILIGPAESDDTTSPARLALELEALLRGMHRRLTRFEDDSELSELNEASEPVVAVSPTLALAVRAGLWAAERSDGLVDPTLVTELEDAGYVRSLDREDPVPLRDALATAPPRRPAAPRPDGRWRSIRVDPSNGTVRRPPGVRFDTGGATKGLAADLCAIRLEGRETYAVDLGGDIRLGGESGRERRVDISHPWDHQPAHALSLARGAVATSGLSRRVWPTPEGFAHHLLDPATGRPAWTGVVQATAVAETALEAETLAKMALLSGPERARELLHLAGGVLVLDDGEVEVFAARPAAPAPVRHALAGAGAAA